MDMKMLTPLLLPLALIYGGITGLRNLFFDLGIFKSHLIKDPSIGVGNLSVGGTGKSVLIDYLIYFFKEENNVVVISRGYKRKTNGVIVASENCSVDTIGDEPYQFFKKHKEIKILVSEKRILGLKTINQMNIQSDILLLDDIMQHRYIHPQKMILTTTYKQPYYNDFLLPQGSLRENRSGIKRAQIIIVTKCPTDLSVLEQEEIKNKIKPLPYQYVFFSKIEYSKKIINNKKEKFLRSLRTKFLLITGVANPNPLIEFLEGEKFKFEHLEFPNHHQYCLAEIEKMKIKNKLILTTEKDFWKLEPYFNSDILYYLPIKMSFFNNSETRRFHKLINSTLANN